MSKPNIGIIGYGQMGRFMASLLAPQATVLAYDPGPESSCAEGPARLVDLRTAASSPIVFLFPPIPQITRCCELIRDHLSPGAIVVEGCSVMCHPVKEMQRLLPEHVELVGCHPLFGPQSGAAGVKGLKVVLAPVRTKRLDVIAELFRPLEVSILTMTAEDHDRAMARTQALEQLIGRVLMKLAIGPEPIDVPGYRKLVDVKELLERDSEELFLAVHHYNPFAAEVRRNAWRAFSEVSNIIEQRKPVGRA